MAAKSKFDPRKLMEKAIEVMRSSVAEKRSDGKPNPLVGAVLVRPDGSIETAARGELREGNHAEFTLLERKCVGEKLDGSVLFATLEPCLNRNHPKRGCARHIVGARIKEVWVGIEDDNPTVAGKGIEHLKRHGVTVHMFDRDLQEVIAKENKAFFEWARQQAEKPEPELIKLSKYEDPIAAVALGDLSEKALERYRAKAAIEPAVDSAEFARLLRQQGLLIGEGVVAAPTGFGFLLFGKEPRNAVPQAGVLARAELADGKSSRAEFGQAMVLIPGQLEEWLNKVLPSTLDRSRMERREQVDLPFEMIREAVVNALIHRDYDIAGQKCQLVVNADTITIKSPGGPIAPITLDQMRSFTAPMKSRNPVLHYVFARMGMAEEQGYGLTSLKKHAEKLGLPLPSYSMEGDSLVLTIYRTAESATKGLGAMLQELTVEEQGGWKFVAGRTGTTQSEYARNLGVTARTAQRHLSHFVKLGLLRRVGRGRATEYLKPEYLKP
jgi:ATP-dependent DNA helicase RecG